MKVSKKPNIEKYKSGIKSSNISKRNEILGRSQEKGKYKDQVNLLYDNHQGKVSGEYSLPRPRKTETQNTAEKHETAAPLQQCKLSNAQNTNFNSTTMTNTHFQTNFKSSLQFLKNEADM